MIYFLIGYSIGVFGALIAISKKFLELQEAVIELQKEIEKRGRLTWELLNICIDLERQIQKQQAGD